MNSKIFFSLFIPIVFVSACICLSGWGAEAELQEKVDVFMNRTASLDNKSDQIVTYLEFWDTESARAELTGVNTEVESLKADISEICRLTEENKDYLSDYGKYKRVCDGYSDYLDTCMPNVLDVYQNVLEYTEEIDAAMQTDIEESRLNASIDKCKSTVEKYIYASGSCQTIVDRYPEILNETFDVSEIRDACEAEEKVIRDFVGGPYTKLYGFIRGPGVTCIYQKEVYPFLAKLSTRFNVPMVDCMIGNTGGKKETFKLTVDVPGWSETSMDSFVIKPKELKDVNQTLVFKQRLYENNEMTDGMLRIKVEKSGEAVFESTKPIRIGSKNDFILMDELEPLLVEWITPNDPEVMRIITKAKEYLPSRTFSGYQAATRTAQIESTMTQLNALYNALQDEGISYVSSMVSFNYMDSQRIRMPRESIQQKSANCIDGTVLFASLAENIGFNTYILLVPGHAYLAVEAYPGATSENWIPIETTMIGTSSFEDSVLYAIEASNEVYSYQGEIIYIDVKTARQLGVTPMG